MDGNPAARRHAHAHGFAGGAVALAGAPARARVRATGPRMSHPALDEGCRRGGSEWVEIYWTRKWDVLHA
eukprot:7387439-Prymnesium_polylepis.1